MTPNEPLLSVRDLKLSFHTPGGVVKALDGLSFEVGRGETLGIVGESGCGKTTACLSVMRLIPDPPGRLEGGELFFENRDILAMNGRELRSFRGGEAAMIFQEPMSALNPVFTVGRQIEEGILLHLGADRAAARRMVLEWLEKAGFRRPERIAASYPFALSGGMRQRVMIAMALAPRPRLLIADEPTASLDPLTRARILRLIDEAKRETGLSCIFVTHDLETLRGFADRVLVMHAGRPCETALTGALRTCSASPTPNPPPEGLGPPDLPLTGVVLLEMRGVSKVFGEIRAVDGVSLEIRRGTTMGLLGESGCGKTTLGRIAVRLLEPASGGLFFEGRDVSRVRGREERRFRRETQMVFQDPFSSLDPRMTVLEIIGEGLRNYGMAKNRRDFRDRVIAAAEKCGLRADQCARYPHQFSGGQRQRIGIARALVTNPRFIVCDEAVSSLDVPVRSQILNLLKDLQDELGLTYLFMTHDLPSALFMSRETAVMYRGRIVEKGPAELVFHRPRHPYTQALLEAEPPPGERGEPVPGCVYAPRCPRAVAECRTKTPADREAEPGHFAACLRV